jgi:hypothetical protein
MNADHRNFIQVHAPRSLTTAVKEAASRKLMTGSEYVRRAAIHALRADGFNLAASQPHLDEHVDVTAGRDGGAPPDLGRLGPDRQRNVPHARHRPSWLSQ